MAAPDSLPTGKLSPELLSRLLADLPRSPDVVVGPGYGRDVAVLDAGLPGHYLVATADPITFATDALAEYAVAVNLNDLATAGAEPRWLLATVLLPAGQATEALAEAILGGLGEACARWGLALVGGHTEVTAGLPHPLVCAQALGLVPRDGYLTAAGVQPGDEILLVGPCPVEGTALLAREAADRLAAAGMPPEEIAAAAALLRDPGLCVLPYARLLRRWQARLHALHDPTEGGVATGLWELALASGVELEVELGGVPVLPVALRCCAALGLDWRGLIASGCLLAAVAPGEAQRLRRLAREAGLPLTLLGVAHEGPPGAPGLPRFDQDEFTRL